MLVTDSKGSLTGDVGGDPPPSMSDPPGVPRSPTPRRPRALPHSSLRPRAAVGCARVHGVSVFVLFRFQVCRGSAKAEGAKVIEQQQLERQQGQHVPQALEARAV